MARGLPWAPEEDAVLYARWADEGAKGTAALLPGRSPSAVRSRAQRLGLLTNHYRRWTPEEDAAIVEHYPKMGAGRMKAALMLPGRDVDAVMNRACALGVRRLTARTWTAREDEAIRACIPGLRANPSRGALKRLARALGRSERHTAMRMQHWLREETA